MTDQEIRIAVAEACSWTPPVQGSVLWTKENGRMWADKDHLPDYCNDLNAMYEAESTLDSEQMNYTYAHLLYNVVVPSALQPFRATAKHRAEAFLKTIGKWTG